MQFPEYEFDIIIFVKRKKLAFNLFEKIKFKIQHIVLAGALGFEPRMAVSKTAALPLGYAPNTTD